MLKATGLRSGIHGLVDTFDTYYSSSKSCLKKSLREFVIDARASSVIIVFGKSERSMTLLAPDQVASFFADEQINTRYTGQEGPSSACSKITYPTPVHLVPFRAVFRPRSVSMPLWCVLGCA